MDPSEQAEALAEQTLGATKERLAALDALPTHEHVAVFDTLQQELSGVLGALGQNARGPR
ncbi:MULTISPECIES: hypothetical protein [Nocardiopsis]|uniref:hypothetical protein n=1 Tax=Nocardiopsis TaxID=2013 RepID=UPI000345BFA8|nr:MULTISPECIES: hypothetical protein [Nocardiopsis]PWV46056.1 hypothetical protein BDW27_115110 [Nocardiopsis sp. L17-MgMaSL7]